MYEVTQAYVMTYLLCELLPQDGKLALQ